MKKLKVPTALLAASLLSGCLFYDVVQSNLFSDEDGFVVQVDYGQSGRDHVNYFRSPANGEKCEFRSRLLVLVHLPDGDSFKAWRCMNFLPSGTMYRSDNEEWMLHANGFSITVYRRIGDEGDKYREVYRGVLCETPDTDFKPSDKWRELKKDAQGRWR